LGGVLAPRGSREDVKFKKGEKGPDRMEDEKERKVTWHWGSNASRSSNISITSIQLQGAKKKRGEKNQFMPWGGRGGFGHGLKGGTQPIINRKGTQRFKGGRGASEG